MILVGDDVDPVEIDPMHLMKMTWKWELDTFFTKTKVDKGFNFSCNTCGYSTLRSDMIKRHVRRQHIPGLKMECEDCGRSYKGEEGFRDHKKRCRGMKSNIGTSSPTPPANVNQLNPGIPLPKTKKKPKKPLLISCKKEKDN